MASENHSAGSFKKPDKIADSGNSSTPENETNEKWTEAVPRKRVLFRINRRQDPSASPQSSSQNNISYSKRKILAGNYPSHDNLRDVPRLVGSVEAEVTEKSDPVHGGHLSNTPAYSGEKSSFDGDYSKKFDGVFAILAASESDANLPNVERLCLDDYPIDGYTYPVNCFLRRDTSPELYGGRDPYLMKTTICSSRAADTIRAVDDYCFSFSRDCECCGNFYQDEVVPGPSAPDPPTSVDDVDYNPARTFPDDDFGVPGTVVNNRTVPNYGAFDGSSSYVDSDTYSFSPDFTLPQTDSVHGFVSPETYPSPPAVFNGEELEDDPMTSTGDSWSDSIWNSIPELWPSDIYPRYYLQCMQSDFSPVPSDTSSVCSLDGTERSPGRPRPPRYVRSPPPESLGTPTGCSRKSYLRENSSTPSGQTKRTFSGMSTNAEDSENDGEASAFLKTPDSEPRYREARSALPDASRRKSFPRSRDSSAHSRTSTADQTPYEQAEDRQKRLRLLLPHYRPWTLQAFKSEVGFVDTHCHLDFLFQRQDYEGTYADYREKHADTFPESYEGCVAVFCNPYTFAKKTMWGKYLEEDGVWAAFGCHPHNANVYDEVFESHLEEALSHPKVVALGEIGVDYSNRNNCTKERQHEVFRRQLKIAKDKHLPLVIHCRDANEDCMRILKEVIPEDHHIHLHCFTDTWSWAEKWFDAFPNLFMGITNVVTFPSAECVHEVAKNIPLNRLLLETDAPYFLPKAVSRRERWSHPGLALHVAAQIAALRDIPLEDVLKSVRRNTERMYGI